MASVRSFVSTMNKPLIEYSIGERWTYIGNRADKVLYTRCEISAELAIAMTKAAGYPAENPQDFGNKVYVCVSDSSEDKRTFVYKHDDDFWLYVVTDETERFYCSACWKRHAPGSASCSAMKS